MLKRALCASLLIVSVALAQQPVPREMSPRVYEIGQSIADALMEELGTDAAFVPVGILNEAGAARTLDRALQFPADDAAVVNLTGKQIRDALERSISLYPSPNPVFLQVSGVEIEFDASKPSDSRLTSVSIGGQALDNAKKYRVGMPGSLARGGLGYSTIWDRSNIEKAEAPKILESILKGRQASSQTLNWKAKSGHR